MLTDFLHSCKLIEIKTTLFLFIHGKAFQERYMNKLRTKLLSELREAIRLKHYSLKTEKSSIHWVRWFTFVCTESRVIIVRMSEDWGEFD
jgi:intracellular septation protein A